MDRIPAVEKKSSKPLKKREQRSSAGKKRSWTKEEDMKLWDTVVEIKRTTTLSARGIKWNDVAMLMSNTRNGKQCRDRWFNHLRTDVNKASMWTLAEDRKLVQLQSTIGNRWTKIAKILGRFENQVKNHWHSQSFQRIRRKILSSQPQGQNLVLSEQDETMVDTAASGTSIQGLRMAASATDVNLLDKSLDLPTDDLPFKVVDSSGSFDAQENFTDHAMIDHDPVNDFNGNVSSTLFGKLFLLQNDEEIESIDSTAIKTTARELDGSTGHQQSEKDKEYRGSFSSAFALPAFSPGYLGPPHDLMCDEPSLCLPTDNTMDAFLERERAFDPFFFSPKPVARKPRI